MSGGTNDSNKLCLTRCKIRDTVNLKEDRQEILCHIMSRRNFESNFTTHDD